jgi:hypothetical protein
MVLPLSALRLRQETALAASAAASRIRQNMRHPLIRATSWPSPMPRQNPLQTAANWPAPRRANRTPILTRRAADSTRPAPLSPEAVFDSGL